VLTASTMLALHSLRPDGRRAGIEVRPCCSTRVDARQIVELFVTSMPSTRAEPRTSITWPGASLIPIPTSAAHDVIRLAQRGRHSPLHGEIKMPAPAWAGQ